MRKYTHFSNFIEAYNHADKLGLDPHTRREVKKDGNKWSLIVYGDNEIDTSSAPEISFSRIHDDMAYVESANTTYEKYYSFFPTEDLLVRIKEKNILFYDKINIIKEIVLTRYATKKKEELVSLIKKTKDNTEKSLLQKALHIKVARDAREKENIIRQLKDLESKLSSLSYEEIKILWENRDEEGFYEETDEFIMLEYFFKKKKAIHLKEQRAQSTCPVNERNV